jgi:hypothetical protein
MKALVERATGKADGLVLEIVGLAGVLRRRGSLQDARLGRRHSLAKILTDGRQRNR